MHLLCKIDDLEPGRKGAHQVARRGRRPSLHARRKLDPGLWIAVAAADGQDAVLLHEVEERSAALFAQDLAHESPQGMHILAQRRVLRRKQDFATVHGEPPILTRAAGWARVKPPRPSPTCWLVQQNPRGGVAAPPRSVPPWAPASRTSFAPCLPVSRRA